MMPTTPDVSKSLGELIRSGSTSHSYPFVIASLALLCIALFGLSVWLPGGLAWLAAGTGFCAGMGAIVLASYAGLRRPDLLRSETHIERMRLLQMAADSDMSPEAAARMLRQPPPVVRKPRNAGV